MKKLIVSSLLIASTFIFCGASCNKTSVVQPIVQSEGVIVTSVDTGMKLWSLYVNSGNATQAQVDQVKAAYVTYFNAQNAAKALLETATVSGSTNSVDLSTANTAVVTAENSLLAILSTYLK
jgi:hypothetical protein